MVEDMSDNSSFTGSHRVVLPKKFFDRPAVFLGGLIGNTDALRPGFELDGLNAPLYARMFKWLGTALLIWLIPLVCL